MLRLRSKKSGLILGLTLLIMAGCASRDNFTTAAQTQFFTQGYNPQELDVLWMVDNRSPMSNVETHLVSEASNFFTRLDALTGTDYRMAFVSADMEFADGALEPMANPQILTKTTGTLAERTSLFASLLSQEVNLSTGALDEGFLSAYTALTNSFIPRTGVPLVLVFISDSDDHSEGYGSTTDVSDYETKFLSTVANNNSLIRVYSVNYTKTGARCATEYNADIDSTDSARPFENTYFDLADDLNGSTADLCGSFAENIDLTGLQLTTLPSAFTLTNTPLASSVQVSVYNGSTQYTDLSWTYNATTNQIVFTAPPPDGCTIQVTYQLASSSGSGS